MLLLGHFDTVWPVGQLDRMPLREEGGRLHGPGVFDMKAGIGVAMLAVRALRELSVPGAPHVTMLWTTDEEIGSGTSRAAIESCARDSRAVLVLEPSPPRRRREDQPQGLRRLRADGARRLGPCRPRPGQRGERHPRVGAPDPAITALQDPGRGITLNVGQISGGSRTNVVADIARASIDVRVRTVADAARVEQSLHGLRPRLPGTRLEIHGGVGRPPLERGPGVVRLYEIAREVARGLGQDLKEGGAGGGSDGNFTAALGVPTLDGLGPRGDGAHALHEHVEIEDLAWRAAFLAGLLEPHCGTRIGGDYNRAMANGMKTVLLLGALSGLLLLIGDVVAGPQGLMIGLVVAAVMNLGSYWFSDKIVLRMYRAQAVGPEHPLYRITERLARQGGLPMPKVYVIPDPSPNAFATGRNPEHAAVAATQGILQILSEHELEGVIAHELAHVKHRDILISSVAATIAAAIMMAARMAMYAGMFGGGRHDDRDQGSNPIALLAMMILAPMAAMLIQAAISRSREFSADAGGAQIAGNPYGLADALRKIDAASRRVPMDANPATAHMFIVKPFSGAGLMSLFSTHPPTEARISALLAGRPS